MTAQSAALDTFALFTAVVERLIPVIAARLNISYAPTLLDSITDEIAQATPEPEIIRFIADTAGPELHPLTRRIARTLRRYYFLDVGAILAHRVGYVHGTDLNAILRISEIFDTACNDVACDDLVAFPAPEAFANDVLRAGFNFPLVTADTDEIVTIEHRRVWAVPDPNSTSDAYRYFYEVHRPAEEGPAILVTTPSGDTLEEYYVEHDQLHNPHGPALISRLYRDTPYLEAHFENGRYTRMYDAMEADAP